MLLENFIPLFCVRNGKYILSCHIFVTIIVTFQLLAYADDVNILGGGVHTLKENAEALVAATGRLDWK